MKLCLADSIKRLAEERNPFAEPEPFLVPCRGDFQSDVIRHSEAMTSADGAQCYS